ncbi:hypothetical protein [Alienimonas sp. DA493]|uniref:hypothetical protein n=1 Tax=Alienimonas sp. DA493 TaxID=3373605 RepID=UPI0037553289
MAVRTACLLSAALTALSGCSPVGGFRAETTFRPDGSVARTVQQDDEFDGDRSDWQAAGDAAVSPAEEWPRPIAAPEAEDGTGATIARGEFPAAAALPDHLRIGDEPDDEPDAETGVSRFVRNAEVIEYGVLTEYRWRETLTAGTSPLKMERARRRGVALAAWWAGAVLEEGMPAGTDASGLVEWIETTGDDWSADLLAAGFGLAARPEPVAATDAPMSLEPFREVCSDYGLNLPEAAEPSDGAPAAIDAEKRDAAVAAFLDELLRTRITVDGRPLDAEQTERARELLFGPKPKPGTYVGETPWAKIERVRARVLAERFGTEDPKEAGKAIGEELGGLVGPTFFRLFAASEVAYRHRMPGLLLSTNGAILDPGVPADGGTAEALFRFDVSAAFPFGHAMTARSVVLHDDRQRELLGAVRIGDRAAAVRFLERMEEEQARSAWLAAVEADDAETLREMLP